MYMFIYLKKYMAIGCRPAGNLEDPFKKESKK